VAGAPSTPVTSQMWPLVSGTSVGPVVESKTPVGSCATGSIATMNLGKPTAMMETSPAATAVEPLRLARERRARSARAEPPAALWLAAARPPGAVPRDLEYGYSTFERVLANRLDRHADNLDLGPDPIRGVGGRLQPLGERQARTVTERQPQFARTGP